MSTDHTTEMVALEVGVWVGVSLVLTIVATNALRDSDCRRSGYVAAAGATLALYFWVFAMPLALAFPPGVTA